MAGTVIQSTLPGSTYQPQIADYPSKAPQSDFKKMLEDTKESKPDGADVPGIKGERPEDEQIKEEPNPVALLFGLPGGGMPQIPAVNMPEVATQENEGKILGLEQPNDEHGILDTKELLQDGGKEQLAGASEEQGQVWQEEELEEDKGQNAKEENQTKEMAVKESKDMPTAAGVKKEQNTELETEIVRETVRETGVKETAAPEVTTVASYMQKDYGAYQANVLKETQTVHVNETHPEDFAKDVTDVIAKSVQTGKQEFEIQLEPLHLGKLAIKVSYEAGKAAVSIICSSTKTLESLAQNAKEISAILDNRLGTETSIIVEHPETDYLNQQNQQKEDSQREQDNEKKYYHPEDEDKTAQTDFLQQLRLGLV